MAPDGRFGARLEFLGIVRAREHGRPISGICYTAYRPMAQRVLDAISQEAEDRFETHLVAVHHVVGFVPAGAASLRIEVAFAHSAEAFEACRWYLRRIKEEVPIWKEPRYEPSQ